MSVCKKPNNGRRLRSDCWVGWLDRAYLAWADIKKNTTAAMWSEHDFEESWLEIKSGVSRSLERLPHNLDVMFPIRAGCRLSLKRRWIDSILCRPKKPLRSGGHNLAWSVVARVSR